MADLPEPILRPGLARPSIIWLIPAVAALIGGWMAFSAWSGRGPTVVISFQSAEGLEAGQTRIRVNDVDMGKVTGIALDPAGHGRVLVTAELKKEAEGLLGANSRFWVVRARIGIAGISGLGTLLSGAYIGFDPGLSGAGAKRSFQGLESPPIVTARQEGLLVTLRAERLGSLTIGSPVRYRQIQVGQVAGFDLDPDGGSVTIKVFVHAPYDRLVRKETRFWDAGGVEFSGDLNGVRMHSESLADLLLGGIAFENPMSLEAGGPAPEGHVFPLHPDHDHSREPVYLERHYFVVNFRESVRGLVRGAPVEHRGIKVGEVVDFGLEFHTDTLEGKVPVLLAVEPERFKVVGVRRGATDRIMGRLVERGLRAQLATGSLLTGSLYVDLAFQTGAPRRTLGRHGAYPEIPSGPSGSASLVASLGRLAERLEKLPLEGVAGALQGALADLKAVLGQAQALVTRLDQETAPQVQATLRQAQATLAGLDQALRADSPSQQELRRTLEEVSRASRAVKDLAETLERNPQSLIFGKRNKP